MLVEVRPLQTISTETIALKKSVKFENPDLATTPAARLKVAGMFEEFKNKARKEFTERRKAPLEATAPNPVAILAAQLKTLGRLEEYKLCSRTAKTKICEVKAIDEFIEQRTAAERRALNQLAERQVLDELAARKESKILEERKARERHKERAERKMLERLNVEWDELRKVNEQPTEPRAPEKFTAHKRHKHCENHKARAAREMQEGLRAYRSQRALEERANHAACEAREKSAAREELLEKFRCRDLPPPDPSNPPFP